jgi:hypothetical protein
MAVNYGRWRFSAQAGRATSDPEKMVTPGLLYASKAEGGISVHLLALGWWDWHISFLVGRLASGMEAATAGETGTGSTEGDSPAAAGGTPVTQSDIELAERIRSQAMTNGIEP